MSDIKNLTEFINNLMSYPECWTDEEIMAMNGILLVLKEQESLVSQQNSHVHLEISYNRWKEIQDMLSLRDFPSILNSIKSTEMTHNANTLEMFKQSYTISQLEKSRPLQLVFQWLVRHKDDGTEQPGWLKKSMEVPGYDC